MNSWTTTPPPRPETLPDEIEHVKGIVGKYFPIYNVQVHFDTISLFCNIDPDSLEEQFEELRLEMKGMAYIPILTYEKGEHVLHVVRQPKMRFKGVWINVILLIATIFTTILAGSVLWGGIFDTGGMFEPVNLLNGAIYFALPLMLILGVHELAHYYAAKRHGIAASLPFFIPIPPPFILGTMGAFISIREPIPNKKALLDIGIAGPIAGFVIALPITIVGLLMSTSITPVEVAPIVEGDTILIGSSLLFQSFISILPVPDSLVLHPLAFAGWVGLFVTALNLLPAGQLDGGHIARALLGKKARFASYGAFILMIVLGLIYTGWLLFALLIMFLGMRHPPPLNDVTKLDNRRKAVGVFAAVMLVLCFVRVPLSQELPYYNFEYQYPDGTVIDPYFSPYKDFNVSDNWTNHSFPFRINNTGNMILNLSFLVTSDSDNCTAWVSFTNGSGNSSVPYFNTTLDLAEAKNLTLYMSCAPVQNPSSITITMREEAYGWGTPHNLRFRANFH
jgi:membrane-associated protease RseP (regulator of RpoE activity)